MAPGLVTATLAHVPAATLLPPDSTVDRAGGSGLSPLRVAGIVSILVALVAILALAVLTATGILTFGTGASTASTPTPTPSPTVPPNFKEFTAPGQFSLDIPADWTAVPAQQVANASADAFVDVSGKVQLFVEVFPAGSTTNLQSIDDQALTQLSAGKPIQNRQPADSALAGGQTWVREIADLPVHGTLSHVIAMTTTHGTHLFLIFYFSPTSTFEVASIADFQPMLNSFAFVG
jgi:hypothetical protein